MSGNFLYRFIGRFTDYVVLGLPVCPVCGSTSVSISGYKGVNRRHNCCSCGSSIRIMH